MNATMHQTHYHTTPASSPTSVDNNNNHAEQLKLERKRSQDRLHQRRHRAKRKMQLSTLEQDVKDLQTTVSALSAKRQRLSYATLSSSNNSSANMNNSSSVSSAGSDAKQQRSAHALQVVREYFEVFKYGHSAIHEDAQEAFLHKLLTRDAAGVDIAGVEAFAAQWRLYGGFFWSTLLEATTMRARASGDVTVVDVDAELHLRLRADLATHLCPQLARHAEVLQTIVDNVISVRCKYTFIVEASGQVSALLSEVDFIDALYRVLGSLVKVAQVADGAQISMCSGTITCALPSASAVAAPLAAAAPSSSVAVASKPQPIGALGYRLQLNFLLSSSS